jgi:two-component system cell cycle response regulator
VTQDDRRITPDSTVITAVSPNPLIQDAASPACLVMIVGSEIGKRIPLEQPNLVLGRSSSANVHLDIDNVSRNHATIERTKHGWVLKDLDSTNGTFVNDLVVRERMLRDGDQIRIGRATLKFLTSGNVEAQYHEEIYRLMTLDGLTQLHNRRYFQETLAREFARSKRYGHPFTLVVFDIDHFKRVNDSYGHLAGDAVLRRMGAMVRGKVRTNDTAARVGGEEFAVILPEADRMGGVALAEKLRKMVEAERIENEGIAIPVTISLGVAEFASNVESAEELYRIADEKLYEAKRSGRNQVRS